MRRLNVKMDGQIAVLAVAEKGSYSAAGKSLEVTESAIRKQVEGMVAELGTAIFRRVGNRLEPTEAGDLFLPKARESVRHARLGVDRVKALLRSKTGDLRIGYSTQLNEQLLEVIARMELKQDGVPELESLLTYQAVSHVLHGRLDVGFGFLPVHEPDLMVRLLMQESMVACFPAGHRLVTRSSIEPVDLENEPMIALARKALPGRHKEIVEYFEGEGVYLRFVRDACLPREALWFVSRGSGVALMARSTAVSIRSDAVLRPLSSSLLTVKSGVFVRRDLYVGYVREFIEEVWSATALLRPISARQKSLGRQ
jgi:DNA-binding transcriptional LysR family regulator